MLFICCTFFVACSKNKTVSSNASNIFSNEEVSYETKLETETTDVGFAQGAALLVERLDSLLFKVLHNELLNNNAYFYI